MIFEKKIVGMYRSWLHSRCDDTGKVYYFTAKDFEGLDAKPFTFRSEQGALLKGYFYSYSGYDASRLIVFDHGHGSGHTAYMKEIEKLCRAGFRVFSYDHTGCMESEGESTRGFAQSLSDLNACITALKSSEEAKNVSISVMGHSWGAFSTLNISAIHKDITHIVVLSGFLSVERIVNQNFPGLLKPYRKSILAIERENNAQYLEYDAVNSIRESGVKALLIYSDNDKLVNAKCHFEPLKAAFSDCENVKLILTHGKGHNPNYTCEAVEYMGKFFADLGKRTKKGALNTEEEKKNFIAVYDWNKMTEQDENVWSEIIAHLNE